MRQEIKNRTARRLLFTGFALVLTAGLGFAVGSNMPVGALAQTSPQQVTHVEFGARQGEARTKISMDVQSGQVIKLTATDADGTRQVPLLKPDDKLALPCAGTEQTCEVIRVLNGPAVKVCACQAQTALLLPAVQKVREAAGGGGGGSLCTTEKPCCYEDHKLQMSICYP